MIKLYHRYIMYEVYLSYRSVAEEIPITGDLTRGSQRVKKKKEMEQNHV